MILRTFCTLFCALGLAFQAGPSFTPQQKANTNPGIFSTSTDIGSAQHGFTTYDPGTGAYSIMGGGADVWGTADDFRFTWTRVSGDASLSADLHIDAPVSYRISKGMLMFRESLDPGSPYADVAIHADGHVTLQYRLTQGGETKDVLLPEHNPSHLRIVHRGNRFIAYAGAGRAEPANAPSITIPMHGAIYAGLGVCSHNTDALQGVNFSRIDLQTSMR